MLACRTPKQRSAPGDPSSPLGVDTGSGFGTIPTLELRTDRLEASNAVFLTVHRR